MERAETIDLYLLRLGVALSRRFPNDESRVLRILSETEDLLRQAVEKNRDAGLAPSEAEREAIRQFGPPETVAERFGREPGGELSPLGLFVRSYPHLGALVGPLVAAAGAVCLVLSAFAAVFGQFTVFGMADPPPSYYLPQCESLTPQEMAPAQVCTTAEPWVPQAAVSHLWLTVGGAAALAAGAAVWGAHLALLRRHVGCWEDQSLPARVDAVLRMLFFGLAGLLLWPIAVVAGPFDYVDFEPEIDFLLAAGVLVTAVFFLAYVRYAWSVYALRA